jgi:RimJ/RimL family protein N-acetyltransferase
MAPAVIEFETARLRLRQWRASDREASDASIDMWQAQFAERGWSNWAVEVRESNVFIARAHWGKGYATEAARGALRVGFGTLGLGEIVSFTTLGNLKSRAVMERIGMRDAHEDFEHPGVPEGSPLRPHCLYRLKREDWKDEGG